MVINTTYGSMATPSENNTDYSAVVTALGAPYANPSNLDSNCLPIAMTAFMVSNGSAAGSVGGTFATAQNLTRNLPQ